MKKYSGYLKTIREKYLHNKFINDVIWNVLSFGFVTISVTLINIFIGNHYGAGGLGVFNFAFSVYTVLSALTIFGLKSSVTKHLAEFKDNKNDSKNIIISAICMVLTISTLLVLIFIAILKNIKLPDNINTTSILYAVVALPLFSINEVLMGLLNGVRKMKEYAFTRAIRWVLILTFVLYSVFALKRVEYTLFAFLFTEIFLLIFLLFLNRKDIYLTGVENKWIKTHLSFGYKSSMIQTVNELDTRVSVILVGIILGSTLTGVYSLAYTITSGLIMIPYVIAVNFNPIISNLWAKDKTKLKKHLKTLSKTSSFIVLLSIVGAGITYPIFVKLLMKSSVYDQSIPIFFILLVGTFFLSNVTWKVGFLPMIGKPEKHLKIKTILLLINVSLNLAFLPLIGIYGAALGTTISWFLFNVVLNKVINRELA